MCLTITQSWSLPAPYTYSVAERCIETQIGVVSTVVSGEKATVTTELGTEGTDVESLSSPEESRALYGPEGSGMALFLFPLHRGYICLHPLPCHTLWPYRTSHVPLCLHGLQIHMPGGSFLCPSASRLFLVASLDHVKCHPLCGRLP